MIRKDYIKTTQTRSQRMILYFKMLLNVVEKFKRGASGRGDARWSLKWQALGILISPINQLLVPITKVYTSTWELKLS